jgi:glycosyltransferase involved in cell wall biosynthesis
MNILIINPNQIQRFNWGHQLFKNEFTKHYNVTFYGEGFKGYKKKLSIPNYLEKMKRKGKGFDLIITYESKWTKTYEGIEEIKNIPKAHIVSDYIKPEPQIVKAFSNWENVDNHLRKIKPDVIFVRTTRHQKNMKKNLGFDKIFFLPFSVDTKKYYDKGLVRNIDVMATYSTRSDIYPKRRKIQKIINNMNVKTQTKRVIHDAYIIKLNQSKIFVNSTSLEKDLSMKFTEAMACGTLFITDESEDMERVGFQDGKNIVVFSELKDLKEKIEYYLKNKKERNRIAKNGMKLVRKRHSNAVRVKEFMDIVRREVL